MGEVGTTHRLVHRIGLFCAYQILLVAFLTFLGWISGLSLLASVRAIFGAVPTGRMAPMTAAAFVITAAALFCLTSIGKLRATVTRHAALAPGNFLDQVLSDIRRRRLRDSMQIRHTE
jgi:hypothetical protein